MALKGVLSEAAGTLDRINNACAEADFDDALTAIQAVPVNIEKACA
ncbi:MAG TPA: hypothetical protein VGP16_26730 [Asanoa sp.]|jgi:hypothetical protein|nr:hypothetical protein [Asanoa sp.]